MKKFFSDSCISKGAGKSSPSNLLNKTDSGLENPIGSVTNNGIFAQNKDFLVVRIDKLSNIRKNSN